MKLVFLIFLVATLVGCNANPFKGIDASVDPTPIRNEVRPALGIDSPGLMVFDEGRAGEYEIKTVVPEGEAVLEFEDLPLGAAWDATKGAITWTPNFTQANDPNNYNIKTREYPITVILYSSVDLTQSVRKTVLLQVKDTPRLMVVSGLNASYSMKEGEPKVLGTFSVVADDYSAADVRAELKDPSIGMKLVRSGANAEWSLKAEYGVEQLRVGSECRSSGSCSSALENTVVLTGPDGRQQTQDFTINLSDVRQETRTSLSTELVVKGDMSQAFTVSDANKEVAPKVTLVSTPPVGIFDLRQVSATAPESTYVLSWSDIPADATGQVYEIELSICNSNYGFATNSNRCRAHRMKLSVEARTIATPTISRGDWGQESIKYVQFGKALDHTIAISAGNSGLRIRSSGIASSDVRDQVSLVGNQIRVVSQNPGLKTLSVTVMNSVGGVANAVFLYEVLPSTWSENIIIASYTNAPEFAELEKLWGKASRVYYGGHNLNDRALAFRKTLTVGTQSMGMPEVATDMSFFAKNMKRILVTTPLLANLPADILEELKAKGLYLGKRASSVANFNLADYALEVVPGLGAPTKRAGLKGLTTKESTHPSFIELSLENNQCKELFGLLKPGEETEQYVIGASCPLSGGRKIVILGFEWSDLNLNTADAALVKQWFERIWE